MEESLLIITSSITILSLVFLFLYLRKFEECLHLKNKIKELKQNGSMDPQVQRARDEFIAMIVHELRSPLAVIRGSSDMLIKEAQSLSADQILEILNQIRSSSTDLLNLVNDLLDVSKIESGRLEVYKKYADINQILEDESRRYLVLTKEKELELKVDLDPSIPNLNFDIEKIRQVMNNLLSNAIKFTPARGIIEVSSERVGNYIRVTVSDTGIGIDGEVKKRIFHKYVQGKPRGSHVEKGTGLGLVIAKGIVEAHGGSIWVEDNNPKGCRFMFTLPIS